MYLLIELVCHQVQFLHEDRLIEQLAAAISECLKGANTSRTFYSQSLARGRFQAYHYVVHRHCLRRS